MLTAPRFDLPPLSRSGSYLSPSRRCSAGEVDELVSPGAIVQHISSTLDGLTLSFPGPRAQGTHTIPILRSLAAFSHDLRTPSLTHRRLLPGPLRAYLVCRDVPRLRLERVLARHGASRPTYRSWRLAAARRFFSMLEGEGVLARPGSSHSVARGGVAAQHPGRRSAADDRTVRGPGRRAPGRL